MALIVARRGNAHFGGSGMALGYPDPADTVNTFTPDRMGVGEFVTFVEALNG